MTDDPTLHPPTDPADDLLWQAGQRLDPADPETGFEPTDSELAAYRRGELRGDGLARVEEALVRSPSVRARLARSAGVTAPTPRPQVRERVLESFRAAFQGEDAAAGPAAEDVRESSESRVLPWTGRPPRTEAPLLRRSSPWIALAAGLVLAVLWLRSPAEPLPGDVRWTVEATGLAQVRGSEEVGEAASLELLPGTLLRLEASPDRAVADVETALFQHRDGESVERLDVPPGALVAVDGAVRLEVVAGELLGEDPQSGVLILVIGRPGRLPSASDLRRSMIEGPSTDGPRTEYWWSHAFRYRLGSGD